MTEIIIAIIAALPGGRQLFCKFKKYGNNAGTDKRNKRRYINPVNEGRQA